MPRRKNPIIKEENIENTDAIETGNTAKKGTHPRTKRAGNSSTRMVASIGHKVSDLATTGLVISSHKVFGQDGLTPNEASSIVEPLTRIVARRLPTWFLKLFDSPDATDIMEIALTIINHVGSSVERNIRKEKVNQEELKKRIDAAMVRRHPMVSNAVMPMTMREEEIHLAELDDIKPVEPTNGNRREMIAAMAGNSAEILFDAGNTDTGMGEM